MVRREKEKAAVLILSAACIIICLLTPVIGVGLTNMGICSGCSLTARFAYSFFHASVPHALINCWCLLSIAFIYRISFGYLIAAYTIAVTYPVNAIYALQCSIFNVQCSTPTIGLSAVCFALMGMVSFQSQRRLYFHAWVLSFIGVSALLAAFLQELTSIAPPNNLLHIYCYVCGIIIGILNTPLITYGR
jgi:membrane associated rhomboid family serine protease